MVTKKVRFGHVGVCTNHDNKFVLLQTMEEFGDSMEQNRIILTKDEALDLVVKLNENIEKLSNS